MPLLSVGSPISVGPMFTYILHFDLQWDKFLKLGDVPEVPAAMVNKIIRSQKPAQCAQLIYTVS